MYGTGTYRRTTKLYFALEIMCDVIVVRLDDNWGINAFTQFVFLMNGIEFEFNWC